MNNNKKMKKKELLIFIAAFGFTAISCILSGIGFYMYQARISHWPTVDGRVLGKRISQHVTTDTTAERTSYRGSDGEYSSDYYMYSGHLDYVFYVDGKEYTSDKIWPVSYSTSDMNEIQDMLNEYNKGDVVKVHYNPESPEDCCIKSEISLLTFIPFVLGLIFMIPTVIFSVILSRGNYE